MEQRRMDEPAEHPIYAILDQDIPEARQNLNDSHVNLEKLAHYCRNNFIQNADKVRALDETKNFTIQALASVAYQINAFSYHLMQLFDHQDVQVAEMETEVRHLNQTVSVHKEKIARREIGGLATTNKPMQRQHKVLQPPTPERATRYSRRPIDYSSLDDVGHGMKMTPSNGLSRSSGGSSEYGTRKSSDGNVFAVDGSGSAIYGRGPAKGPLAMTTGTLSRNQARNMGDYRTPVVQPPPLPVIPGTIGPSSHYGPGHLANGLAAVHLQQHLQQGQQSPYMDRSGRSSLHSSGRSQGPYHPDSLLTSIQSTVPNSPSLRSGSTMSSAHSPQPHSHYGTRSNNGPQHQPVFQYPPPVSSNMPRKTSNGSNASNGNYGLTGNGNMNGIISNGNNGHQTIRGQEYSPLPPPPADLHPGTYSRSSSYNDSHTASPLPISKQIQRISQNGHIAVSSPPLPPPPPPNPTLPVVTLTGGHLGGMSRPLQQQQPVSQEMRQINALEDGLVGDLSLLPASFLEKVVAVYDYQADKEDELTFMEGQIIFVMKKNDDGWYEGVMDGMRGLFPGNYVEPCHTDNVPSAMLDFPNRHTITH